MSDDDLAAEVEKLRSEVEALHRRVTRLEQQRDVDRQAESEPAEAAERDVDSTPETGVPADDGTDSTADADEQGGRARDWERDVGIKWLGLVGGAALVVGVVYFVRLAIEAGLLGYLGRVLLGTAGGLALMVGGRAVAERQGYVRWGRIAAGAGLAIAYFSLYAAYGFETYRAALGTPLWAVLLGQTVLVAGAVVLSIRDGAPLVAGQAFLLGYVTAYLGLDAGTFAVTPVYALLLAAGLVAIVTVRSWSRHVLASVLPTYGILGIWAGDVDPPSALFGAVVAATFAVYLAGGYLLRSEDIGGEASRLSVAGLTVLNGLLAAGFLEDIVRDWVPDAPVEGLAVGLVAAALAGAYAVTARRSVTRDDAAGALAVVLTAVSVVLAATLATFAATVGLLAVVCGAVALAHWFRADAVRTGAHLVAAGTAFKLAVVDVTELAAADLADPLATATGRAAAFALGIAVAYGLAWWFRDRTEEPAADLSVPLAVPYSLAGTVLTVLLLWLELSGLGVSVAWAVFGFVLVGAGLATDVRGLRFQGVAVLGLATAKVFLYDTRDLDTMARTLSFLVLGAVLLAASYAYARWQGEDPIARLTGE